MFRCKPLGIMLVAAVALRATPGVADTATDTAKMAVQGQYTKMDAALSKRDAAAYLKFCTSDMINEDQGGQKANLQQTKQQITTVFSMATALKSSSVVQKAALSGGKLAVHVKQHATLSLKNPQTGQASSVVIDGESEDSWVKSNGVWLLKYSKTVLQKTTVDGKAVPSK